MRIGQVVQGHNDNTDELNDGTSVHWTPLGHIIVAPTDTISTISTISTIMSTGTSQSEQYSMTIQAKHRNYVQAQWHYTVHIIVNSHKVFILNTLKEQFDIQSTHDKYIGKCNNPL